jgi:predicted DNA-binding ribbon-helix-helix protein
MAKRSITIAGHRTSISLEKEFWDALAEIAKTDKTSLAALVARIDRARGESMNLSAAIRVFVLDRYRGRTG